MEKAEKGEKGEKTKKTKPEGHKRWKIKYKSDLNKSVIIDNFTERNWISCEEDDEHWNFYWASVNTTIKLCGMKSSVILRDNQVLAHFPNFYELTKKDCMAKNIKCYRKQQIKDGVTDDVYDYLPVTYLLPIEINIFIEEFKRDPNCLWILKPSNKCQGQGITLINKCSKVKKIMNQFKSDNEDVDNNDIDISTSFVISKYIKNPLLIGGKKFDLRIYCLVTSFVPLKAFLFQLGFCRFCNEKFSIDITDLDNLYMHLTNVAIQQKYKKYSSTHGGKFSLFNLFFYLQNLYGYDKSSKCYNDIKEVIIHSLKSVQPVMNSNKHCFECYGYDIMLDDNLKPWLIEINSSPSLATTTKGDHILKKKLINDVLDIVITDKWIETKGRVGANSFTGNQCGYFDILYDGAVQDSKNKKVENKNNNIYINNKKQKNK